MSDCKTVRLGEILQIQPKSKIKAGDGVSDGRFKTQKYRRKSPKTDKRK